MRLLRRSLRSLLAMTEFPQWRRFDEIPDQVGQWHRAVKAGIFMEIASSFVSLTPRNDGDLMRLLPRNDAGNSRIFVIASEAKQSLGILNLSLGNSRILYYVILALELRISIWNSRFRNSSLRNSRIPYYFIPQLDWGISIWNSRIP